MQRLLLVLILSLTICSVTAILSSEQSFIAWIKLNRKNYHSNQEFKYRLSVYQKNLEFIEEHNRNDHGFKLAMNKFGDLTNEEYNEIYLPNKIDSTKLPPSNKIYSGKVADDVDIDWRNKHAVTPVKNQGQCGSCWAFSTCASIEGAWAINIGKLDSYSPQQIMDCSQSYGNEGCNGGLIDPSFKYIIDNGGIDTWKSYPYEAKSDFNCRFKNETIGATIIDFKDIEANEASLQSAVYSVGPVSGAIDASRTTFQFYSSGVYYDKSCSSKQLDHGINVVGLGTTDDGTEYYIVKNMWGTDWGNQGYVLMARNRDNNCGIATMASFPIVSEDKK